MTTLEVRPHGEEEPDCGLIHSKMTRIEWDKVIAEYHQARLEDLIREFGLIVGTKMKVKEELDIIRPYGD
jgi:hypothetical protein